MPEREREREREREKDCQANEGERDKECVGTAESHGADDVIKHPKPYERRVSASLPTWQAALLQNERNDIDIICRRLEANVLLIKALGGGWDHVSVAQQP